MEEEHEKGQKQYGQFACCLRGRSRIKECYFRLSAAETEGREKQRLPAHFNIAPGRELIEDEQKYPKFD